MEKIIRKMNTKLFLLALSLFFIPGIFALSISINMKPSFSLGDIVSFNYTLLSNVNEDITYIPAVICPNAPVPLLNPLNATLQANVPYSQNSIYLSDLSDDIDSQNCTAIVSIFSPVNLTQTQNFSLITNPSFNFNLKTCKDIHCGNQSRIFIRGDNIYFNFTSEINPQITATLLYPDNITRSLSIPTSIQATQLGPYQLNVTASRPGYKIIDKQLGFAVIAKEANIPYTSLAVEKQQTSNATVKLILIIAGGVVLLTVIILIISINLVRKRKS